MESHKETDFRKLSPETVYETKKIAVNLHKKGKTVKEIVEATGLSDKTVRNAINEYQHGGLRRLKSKVS